MRIFGALLRRELALAWRHGSDSLAALLFFVLVVALFPLALGPEPALLRRVAPGIIWVAALLACLLPLERLFGADAEDGSLDQLLLSGASATMVGAAKTLAHWLTTGLPLVLVSVLLGVVLDLPPPTLALLPLSLAPGTATLSLLGTMGSAIVLGARRGAVLLPLLILPLATPVLIFGAEAADAATAGVSPRGALLMLCALLALAAPACPIATGAALRSAASF